MRKPRATFNDFDDGFSYNTWKTIPEVIRELRRHGKNTSHIEGNVYTYMSQQERNGLFRKREKLISPEKLVERHILRETEYLRVSLGTREEIPNRPTYRVLDGRLVVA